MITTFLDTLPTAPSRTRPSDFSEESDNFLYAIVPFQSDINSMAVEINSTATDVNNDRAAALTSETNALAYEQIAMANANFKGQWSTLTGTLAIPASVEYDGKFWILLSDLSDVTAKVPGVDSEWRLVSLPVVGDILFSTLSEADMESRGYLPCDNSTYLQSAYPALYAKLGLLDTFEYTSVSLPSLDSYPTLFFEDTDYFYLSRGANGYDLYVIDKTDYSITTTIADVLYFAQNDDYIFLSIYGPSFKIYRKSDFTELSVGPFSPAGGAYKIAADTDYVYITSVSTPYLMVIQTSDWTQVASTPTLTAAPYGNIIQDTNYVYISHNGGSSERLTKANLTATTTKITIGGWDYNSISDDNYLYMVRSTTFYIVDKSDLSLAYTETLATIGVCQNSTHVFFTAASVYPYVRILKKSDFSIDYELQSFFTGVVRGLVATDKYLFFYDNDSNKVGIIDLVNNKLYSDVSLTYFGSYNWFVSIDDIFVQASDSSPYLSIADFKNYDTGTEFTIPTFAGLSNTFGYNPFIKAE